MSIPCTCPDCGTTDGILRLSLDDCTCYTCQNCEATYTVDDLRQHRDAMVRAYDAAISLLERAAEIAATFEE